MLRGHVSLLSSSLCQEQLRFLHWEGMGDRGAALHEQEGSAPGLANTSARLATNLSEDSLTGLNKH